MKTKKDWLLVQANPRRNSGSAWMFAVSATGEDEAETKVKKWAARNRKRFSLITSLGKIEDDRDYRNWMKIIDVTDRRQSIFPLGHRFWSIVSR